jgi:hypothetical protein
MKKYFKTKLLFIFTSLFLLHGCASTNNNNNNNMMPPDWVLNPAQDNTDYIYGVGEGSTLQKAKQQAIRGIASKFSTKVKSESESRQRQTINNGQEKYNESFSQKVNTEVKDIEFTQVEQKKAEKVDRLYYVQVAIPRKAFIKDKTARLNTIMNNISTILLDVKDKSQLHKLYAYNKIQAKTAQAEPIVYLIQAADKNFNSETYFKQFYKYRIEEAKLLSTTKFKIKSPRNLSPIANSLSDLLETYGFQVTRSNSYDAVIQLQGSVKNTKAYSTYNTLITFSFLVKSPNGILYSKNAYKLNGASVSNHQVAYQNSADEFKETVKTRSDIYKLLGFNGK